MKSLAWVFLLISLFSLTADDVALKTEKKLLSLQSVKADFEQVYYSGSVSTPLRERGKFTFSKPDSMKWEYKDPEEKIFLFEKGNFLFYDPEENQLMKGSFSEEDPEAEIFNLLSGKKSLRDNYIIEFSPFPSEKTDAFQLKLTPKDEEEYSLILLEIDKKTWLIGKAILFDWSGNKNEYRFTKIKTNVRIPKNFFELKLPPDVEIIEKLKNQK
jgi:outer membrane lipoprotein carrier protein